MFNNQIFSLLLIRDVKSKIEYANGEQIEQIKRYTYKADRLKHIDIDR